MAPPPSTPSLSIGSIVHFVDDSGSCIAAIVTRILATPPTVSTKKPPTPSGPSISVHVFHPTGYLSNSYDVNPVQYDEEKDPGTWHWPE